MYLRQWGNNGARVRPKIPTVSPLVVNARGGQHILPPVAPAAPSVTYNVFDMTGGAPRPAQPQTVVREPFNMSQLLHTPVLKHFDNTLTTLTRGYADCFHNRKEARAAHENTGSRKTGDQIVVAIQKQLDSFGLVREEHQRQFHDMFIDSCLPMIYAREWSNDYERILRRRSIKKLHQESLIVCPRRYGKTYSVAMFCAAYLMNVPGCEIALFSTGKRTAGKLMSLILSFLVMIPGFRERIQTKNQELLELNFGTGDTRKLNCYPGSVAVHFLFYLLSFLFFLLLFLHHGGRNSSGYGVVDEVHFQRLECHDEESPRQQTQTGSEV